MRIVVTGSVAFDYLMAFPGYFREHILPDKIAVLSVSFLVESMKKDRGGTAPNIAYNLALLSERPEVAATVGEDFGDYRAWLEEKGVDTAAMAVVPGEFTASCFINTDLDGNQITAFYPGAMAHAATVKLAPLGLMASDLVFISPNDPAAMRAVAAECRALGVPYIYDPSMQAPRLTEDELREGLAGARILTGNDYEFALMAEKLGLSEDDFRALVPVSVVTRGEDGATIYAEGAEFHIPAARPREVVNPTGAGDAFRAGLAKGIAAGKSWDICGRMAAVAGVYAVEQLGTQQHTYTLDAFAARYAENYGPLPEGALG